MALTDVSRRVRSGLRTAAPSPVVPPGLRRLVTSTPRLPALVRETVHWGVVHGVPGLVLRRAARQGDLQARMIMAGGDVQGPIETIRAAGPVVRAKFSNVVTSHVGVREVLTRDEFVTGFPGKDGPLSSIAEATAPRSIHPLEPPSLLATDPPDHTRYRRLVTGVFTMRAVQKLQARTEELATELLDAVEEKARRGEPVDVVADYCAPLPVSVIAEVLGVPEEEHERVLAFGAAAAPSLDLGLGLTQYRSVHRALAQFDDWLGHHLAELRRNPGDNLLSQLVHAEVDGAGLSETELRATAGLVLAAGFETTVNLLSNGIALLATHPDQLAKVRSGEATWTNTVEEVLRYDPPVLLTARQVAVDTELLGHRVNVGTLVAAVLWGANRDPEVFDDPHTFDVTRANAREHISFSSGRHHCLGASLARMEGEVGLRAFFERFGDVELSVGATRRTTRILRGYETLPVVLGPPPHAAV
ncbi:cytochrome P450 [Nocardioides daphniae]|uniref:Cytochrome P450 n=1 Tax=Nocardioides daphniae TaxID=402297 RepID=A0A4P7UB16_9ACTN|nr:cytochrome P450 [Nocardioides daphniae]QCC76109.1 cytochrome P450 [Nocardioides daphniae]GGD10092.1 cytochrome P450 [Nocardioides daphniae]